MKKILLLLLVLSLKTFLIAQKTELRIYLHGNTLRFTGNGATETAFFIPSDYSGGGYTNGLCGTKSEVGFGVSFNAKHISASNLLYGGDFGYENLRNRIDVTRVVMLGGSTEASGKSIFRFNNLNLYGFLGYRFPAGKINLDLSGGAEVGFILSSKEKYDVRDSTENEYNGINKRDSYVSADFRPRLQLDVYYKKFGVYVGYSFGLVNYLQNFDGENRDAKSRIFRFGISYQLK